MPDVLTSMAQVGIFCQQDIVQKSGVCFCPAVTENVFINKVRSDGKITSEIECVCAYIST